MMKKEQCNPNVLLIFAFAFLISIGCDAKTIDTDSAAAIASRMLNVPRFKLKKVRATLNHSKRNNVVRNINSNTDALHIFTPESGSGFVIVAGDDAVKPILGYSATGHVCEEMPPSMQGWLHEMCEQIELAKKNNISPSNEVARQWKAPSIGTIMKEMETAQWGQHEPFYDDCPYDGDKQCLTGCVPTSFAILMKYYEYPLSRKNVIHPYTTKTEHIYVDERRIRDDYHWDEMLMDYRDGYSSRQGRYVANLMADIGAAFKVDYGSKTTSGYMGLFDVFSYFDFNPGTLELKENYSLTEWNSKIKNQLRQSQPVWYRGADISTDEGHAFILDGYTNRDYYRINWGWDGNFNGYYTLDALTPDDYDYSSGQSACFGVIPMDLCPNTVTVGTRSYRNLDSAILEAVPNNGEPTVVTISSENLFEDNIYIDDRQHVVLKTKSGVAPIVNLASFIKNDGILRIEDDISFFNYHPHNNIIVNNGTLIIDNGQFNNLPLDDNDNDTRKCILANEDSQTTISGGFFNSFYNTLLLRGNAEISGGHFFGQGNCEVLSNYNKKGLLTIKGGVFTNSCFSTNTDTDYRRAIWTDTDTNTKITGGEFVSPHQVMCFNGNATIDNAAIKSSSNEYGCSIFSGATVIINSCSLLASEMLYQSNGSNLICRGGIYSNYVDNMFIDSGYECVSNTDPTTRANYPFMVQKIGATKVEVIQSESKGQTIYSPLGYSIPKKIKGFNLIRRKDGSTHKVLVK